MHQRKACFSQETIDQGSKQADIDGKAGINAGIKKISTVAQT